MAVSRRNLMLWAGGAMIATGAGALAAQIDRAAQTSSSQIRAGVVVDYSAGVISVRFAGGVVADFPYLRGYEPILGEVVLLAANGSAWTILGGFAGMPADNPVINGGFEDATTDPWGKVDSGAATGLLPAFALAPPIEGVQCAELASNGLNVSTVIYSNPIPVKAGQRWSADCYLRTGNGSANPGRCINQLFLSWYANDTDVYPTTAAADSLVSLQELPAPLNIWTLFRPFPTTPGAPAGFAVPAGVTHMRVSISHSTADPTQVASLFIDRVVARRLDQLS